MNHKDIVQIIESLKVTPLTRESFESFVQNASGLFVPKGARFQKYFSPGFNRYSKEGYDWSNGKPEWRADQELVFERIERREIPKEGKEWINVYFDGDYFVWGIKPAELPLKFAFDSNKAFYIAEQVGNGTPEQPWEELFMKLE